MVSHYVTIAVRNLLRHKTSAFINIAGLSIGIAGSLLILVYVANQLNYESMHENRDRICRVSVVFGSGVESDKTAESFPALGPAAAAEIPDVVASVRMRRMKGADIAVGTRHFSEDRLFFADADLFHVFTFPLVAGNDKSALRDPSSIVISETTARKYFGDVDPMGKRLVLNAKYEFTVSGVMKDVPPNTMIRCELIAPYLRLMEIQPPVAPWWELEGDFTYLLLKDNASIATVGRELQDLFLRKTDAATSSKATFALLPIHDVYLHSTMVGELEPTGNIVSIYLFSSIAVLVLFVACLNFVNLSTAESLRRAKEIGLRKVLGAYRRGLVLQFFAESFAITTFSLCLGLALFELLNPLLYVYFNIPATESPFLTAEFYIVLFCVGLFVSIIAGLYPALFLSRFKPVDALRGTRLPGSTGAGMRKILVTLQYAITTFLIIGTVAIREQLAYMRQSDLGFEKDQVLVVKYPADDKVAAQRYPIVTESLRSTPGVVAIAGAYTLPGMNSKEVQRVQFAGPEGNGILLCQAIAVDKDFVPTLGLKLVEGRNFSAGPSDSADAIILNESAVKGFGTRDPLNAEISLPTPHGQWQRARVVGVVQDFHVSSFHSRIEPMFLYLYSMTYRTVAVKIHTGNVAATIGSMKAAWQSILPDTPFEYSTLDDTYSHLYRSDEKTAGLFSLFSFLSIFIACLGLIGLVSYTINVRTKEMGIRKVLGGTASTIVGLLSRSFLTWIVLANLIAWPAAYVAVSKWLEAFAYRISIGPNEFLLPSTAVVVLSLIAISFLTIKAARANPVEALRQD